ncbi:MAG: hypothetical protein II649_08310 [Kiritimatiellae bacterium]|nr:hypothetical protein [Kiritimatiellia bacterium]
MNAIAWTWLLAFPVALLLAAGLCRLRERRLVGMPRTAIDRWRRATPAGKLLVCLVVVQFTYMGATKLMRNPPPRSTMTSAAAVQSNAGDLDSGVGATNICFTAIERGTNSTVLIVGWPSGGRPSLDRVGLFFALEPQGPWSHLFDLDVSTCPSNALVEIMDAEISTNSPSAAFFRLGESTPPDADGDGLSDAEEVGEIAVRSEFEWHDTSGLPTVYAPPPPPEEDGIASYFGVHLTAGLPSGTVINGVALSNVFAFENGFVALSAPDDFNGWVFPDATCPLCYRWGYSYSILIASYWSWGCVQYGNTNSYMRAGTLGDGTTVVEFHDVKYSHWSDDGMTYQVIIPSGTGNIVRVSYLSSDVPMDGTAGEGFFVRNVQAGVQNARRELLGGKVYSVEWNFAEQGSIVPPLTVEYRLGTGTDPDSADSDGDGLDDWTELHETETDPWNADADGDGLSDGDEIAWGTNPHASDTDGDGLPDIWEVSNGIDPTSSEGDDGAAGDPDEDNLNNSQERQLGTDPQNSDTDGDGIFDGDEVFAGTSPLCSDTDGDGLDDFQEQSLATDPLQPDTDGDGMDDGWEHRHGFDPKTHNSSTARTDDDATADPDGDGLSNAEECKWGTNPGDGGADTDGDGVADGTEIAQGSDPADPSDGGQAGSRIPVPFCFGDHSESHSEKYLLEVKPVAAIGMGAAPRTFSWVNAHYGECETRTAMLKPGWKYEARLRHASTNLSAPDYDYTLRPVTNGLPPFVQISDSDSLFGTDDTGTAFSAEGKVAAISVYKFTVEEIKFNHDMASCMLDAITIRRNARESFDSSHGEWWIGGMSLKNDPVCYAGRAVPTVKAKIRVSPNLKSARLSASSTETSSPIGGLMEKRVLFSEGLSSWTDFSMDSAIAAIVRKFDHRWEWTVTQIDDRDVTAFICTTTGPHRVFTVIDTPVAPWGVDSVNRQNPWTNALEFACTVADGKGNKVEALAAVTHHLFYNMGFRYETKRGASRYYSHDRSCFKLSSYLQCTKLDVNCYDQAYGVATLGNLLGIYATPVFTQPFGFINTVNLVGIGRCNNPFYSGTSTSVHAVIEGSDNSIRSAFGNHMYVFAEEKIFDACTGPEMGIKTHIDYLKMVIDSSTEDELLSSFFSPLDFLETPRVLSFETRNYRIE